jgi:hypothetical protein
MHILLHKIKRAHVDIHTLKQAHKRKHAHTHTQLESSLDAIPQLPSASTLPDDDLSNLPPSLQRKNPWKRVLAVSRVVAVLAGGAVALVTSHAFGLAVQLLSAVLGVCVCAHDFACVNVCVYLCKCVRMSVHVCIVCVRVSVHMCGGLFEFACV